MPTESEIDRACRKANNKVLLFEAQIKKYRQGKDGGPEIMVGTHPDLPRVMCIDWMAGMAAWKENAIQELSVKMSLNAVRFAVDGIGGVKTVLLLNGKHTRVELFLPDHRQPRNWTIILEPLASSREELF